jgi:type I restriction enzyme S subunit
MEGQELPVGWSSMELNDAGIWGSGGTPSRKNPRYYENGTIPWLVIGDLNDQPVEAFSTSITELGLINSSAKLIPTGSLLVAMYGSIGKLGITTFPCTTNQAIAFCIPNEELVELRYLFHALANAKPELIAKGQGGAQQNISQGILKEHLIHLSPLNEQRRVAAKLDTTLADVDACRQRLDGVAAILKRFRQAVLAAATAGELTREWREERGLEHEWEQSSIDQIAEVGTGSTPLRSNSSFYAAAGTAWITSAATSRELITEASEFVTSEGQAASRLRIYPEGTLLVAMYGEGKTRGQVSELGIPATINQACAAIHAPKDQYLMPFIKIALKANYLKMRSLAEGGNQPNLNLSKIKQFRIGLPPKSEVFEIIDRVESLFTIADQLEAKLTGAHKIVDRLTPALLAKAFRGELVPQDPNDEPASVLLKRIRAARQAEVGAGKPSRRGRRNAHVSLTKPTTLTNMLTRNDVTSNHLTAILKECGPLSAEALWSASQLEIDDFYDQLRDEEAQGLLRENCGDSPNSPRLLEPAA